MNAYIALKIIHVISSTVLFGTGLGIAFFKWIVDRSGNVSAIRVVSERVVLADWLFTTPAILVQAMTGIALAIWQAFLCAAGGSQVRLRCTCWPAHAGCPWCGCRCECAT